MSTRSRLTRLEQVNPAPVAGPGWVTLDDDGTIIDDGRPETREWVGKLASELPVGVPCKIYKGFDPATV